MSEKSSRRLAARASASLDSYKALSSASFRPSISSGVMATSTSVGMLASTPSFLAAAAFLAPSAPSAALDPGITYTWSVPRMVPAPTDACFCSRTWYSCLGCSLSEALRRLSMVSGVSMPLGRLLAMPLARPVCMPDMMPVAVPASISSSSISSLSSSLSSSSSSASSSPHFDALSTSSSESTSSTCCPNTSPYTALPASSTGGFPHPPGWYPNEQPGGIGALRPGILRSG
mmetsp:Transcript_38145/g.113000  ORF Transcript_38145/g.113000 Transcript_38145/m.113000 type:complete len:231 (-) Transcript_38145:1111-1803(-)